MARGNNGVGALFVALLLIGAAKGCFGGGTSEAKKPLTPEEDAAVEARFSPMWKSGDEQRYALLGVRLGMIDAEVRANVTCRLGRAEWNGAVYGCEVANSDTTGTDEATFYFYKGKLVQVVRSIEWHAEDKKRLWRAFATRFDKPRQDDWQGMFWGARNHNGEVDNPYLAINYERNTVTLQDPYALSHQESERSEAARNAEEREQRAREDYATHVK